MEIAHFNLPHLYLAPVVDDPLEFSRDFGIRKLESLGYRTAGVVSVIRSLAVLIQYPLVSDRPSDGQRDRHNMTTACTALA